MIIKQTNKPYAKHLLQYQDTGNNLKTKLVFLRQDSDIILEEKDIREGGFDRMLQKNKDVSRIEKLTLHLRVFIYEPNSLSLNDPENLNKFTRLTTLHLFYDKLYYGREYEIGVLV